MRVSILLPTRDNPEQLDAHVAQLLASAHDPSSVELIVRADDDDLDTIAVAKAFAHATVLAGPRFEGYSSLHLMYADCAAASHGEWLWLWNDDAEVFTPSWDRAIASLPRECWLAKFNERDTDTPANFRPPIFPIFRREYYVALGHVSLHPCNDSWVHQTMEMAGIDTYFFPNVRVRQPDYGANKEACARAESYYYHPVYRRAREQDALQLKAAYEHWLDRSR